MIVPLLLIVSLILCALRKPSYGLMVYLIIRLCMPVSLRFIGLSFNTVALTIFLLIVIPKFLNQKYLTFSKEQALYAKILTGYVAPIIFLAIISSVTAIVPLDFQIIRIVQFLYTELLPSLLIMLFVVSRKDIELTNYLVLICAIFSTSYAIYTFFTLSNPLYEIFASSGGVMEDIHSGDSRGGMFEGTGVGVLNNKISMSLVALLFFTFFWGNTIVKPQLRILILLLSSLSVVLTSQRSAILGMALFVLFVMFSMKNQRKFIVYLIIFILIASPIIYSIVTTYDQLANVLLAVIFIWNDDMQTELGVGGSSINMRLTQLLAVINIVGIHFIEGLGYGFHEYFYDILNQKGSNVDASQLLGFESILFHEYSNSGIVGVFVYLQMFYRILKMLVSNSRKITECLAFCLIYLLVIIMTDTAGTSYLFFIFVVLIIINRKHRKLTLSN